jgi:hypothetical protein
MDPIDALRYVAMRDVVDDTSEYRLRSIFRWYSKTFHTPLVQVEELPLFEVLQTYFEVRYEDMSEQERQDEIVRLLETEEELAARKKAEDVADAEAEEFARQTEEQAKVKKTAKSKILEAAKNLEKNLDKLKEVLPKQEERAVELPPDIKMSFIEDSEFEEMLEGGMGSFERPPE